MTLEQNGSSLKTTARMVSEEDFAPPLGRVTHYRALPETQYLSVNTERMTVLDPVQTSYFCSLSNLDLSKPVRLDWRDTATNLNATCDLPLFAGPCKLRLTKANGKLTLHWKPACKLVSIETPAGRQTGSGDFCKLADAPEPLEVTFIRRHLLTDPLKLGGSAELIYRQHETLSP